MMLGLRNQAIQGVGESCSMEAIPAQAARPLLLRAATSWHPQVLHCSDAMMVSTSDRTLRVAYYR
jgi:hypothetical protein